MDVDRAEEFAGNKSINATIHLILSNTPEPSRSRMRKKIRKARRALHKYRSPAADASARHIFREFLVGYQLNSNGFKLEYERRIDGKTPDWYDQNRHLMLEVLTCERGGTSDMTQRVARSIAAKVERYQDVIATEAASFVVAVHGDFESFFDVDDCESAIREGRLFDLFPDLSGVIYFAEGQIDLIKQPDSSTRRRQLYDYVYFANPNAARKIELGASLQSGM